jgi:hypothetical protein
MKQREKGRDDEARGMTMMMKRKVSQCQVWHSTIRMLVLRGLVSDVWAGQSASCAMALFSKLVPDLSAADGCSAHCCTWIRANTRMR